jgi:hypothetical protein
LAKTTQERIVPINNPDLYDAVYACVRNSLSHVQTRRAAAPARVYRIVDASNPGAIGAEMYRKPFKSSTNDANRWTGPRPPSSPTSPAPRPAAVNAKPGPSGVYTALGLNDALLGEFAHYAFGTTLDDDVNRQLDGQSTRLTSTTFPAMLARKRIFVYEFPMATPIADLSLSGRAGLDLLALLDRTRMVTAALRAARYSSARDAYLSDSDHSLCRAMAQVVRDALPGYQAIWVSSARAGAAVSLRDSQGDNLVFFGPDGAAIDALKPVQDVSFVLAPNGTYRHVVTAL